MGPNYIEWPKFILLFNNLQFFVCRSGIQFCILYSVIMVSWLSKHSQGPIVMKNQNTPIEEHKTICICKYSFEDCSSNYKETYRSTYYFIISMCSYAPWSCYLSPPLFGPAFAAHNPSNACILSLSPSN